MPVNGYAYAVNRTPSMAELSDALGGAFPVSRIVNNLWLAVRDDADRQPANPAAAVVVSTFMQHYIPVFGTAVLCRPNRRRWRREGPAPLDIEDAELLVRSQLHVLRAFARQSDDQLGMPEGWAQATRNLARHLFGVSVGEVDPVAEKFRRMGISVRPQGG